MTGQRIVATFFWVECLGVSMDSEFLNKFISGTWTFNEAVEFAKIFGVLFGMLVSALTLVRWWYSFERNKIRLLEKYLDSKLGALVAKREQILDRIRNAPAETDDDVVFDFDDEMDKVVAYLDRSKHEKASGVLRDLLKSVENKVRVEERRLDLLQRQKASVALFLGAIAETRNLPDEGLPFVSKALHIDRKDKAALKYQGLLLLAQRQPKRAVNSFNRLRQFSSGSNNAKVRAEAHQLLGQAYLKHEPPEYDQARSNSTTACTIVGRTPDSDTDNLILARALRQLADIARDTPPAENRDGADALYRESHAAFAAVKKKEGRDGLSSLPLTVNGSGRQDPRKSAP